MDEPSKLWVLPHIATPATVVHRTDGLSGHKNRSADVSTKIRWLALVQRTGDFQVEIDY